MPSRRHFIDNAPTTTLTDSIGATDASFGVDNLVGFPTTRPYLVTIDRGTASAEQVLVTNVVSKTVTVTRNVNGQGAFSHTVGAAFEHTANAQDYDEANAHVVATTNVHGITGTFADTDSVQTLSNKTLTGGTATFAAASGTPGVVVTTDADSTVGWEVKDHTGTVKAKVLGDGSLTAAASSLGAVSAASAAVTGNATVGGTLGVTGATTLASAGVTGNATVGGTLGVTGALSAGATTMASAAVTGAASVGGNATVAGTLASGAATVASAAVTGNATVGGTLAVTGNTTMTGTLTVGGVDLGAAVAVTKNTSPGVIAANFTDSGSIARSILGGHMVEATVIVQSTNSITASGGGIADTLCYTLASAFHPTESKSANWGTGGVDGEALITNDGKVTLRSANGTIPAGATILVTCSFLKD